MTVQDSYLAGLDRDHVERRQRLWGTVPRAPLPIPPRPAPRKKRVIGRQDRVPVPLVGAIEPRQLMVRLVSLQRRVGVRAILGRSRGDPVCQARHHLYWLLSTQCGLSTPAIGRLLKRDHTTVMHGIRQHESRRNGELLTQRQAGRNSRYLRVAK